MKFTVGPRQRDSTIMGVWRVLPEEGAVMLAERLPDEGAVLCGFVSVGKVPARSGGIKHSLVQCFSICLTSQLKSPSLSTIRFKL